MRKTKDTLICSLIALVIGAVMGVISGLFGLALGFVTEVHREYYLYLTPFLGAAGIAIVFLYRKLESMLDFLHCPSALQSLPFPTATFDIFQYPSMLICKSKFDCYFAILVNINCVNQFY